MLAAMSLFCLGSSVWSFRTRLTRKDKRANPLTKDFAVSIGHRSMESTVSGQTFQLRSTNAEPIPPVPGLAHEGAETL